MKSSLNKWYKKKKLSDKSQAGFSLIEVMIAVMILSSVSVIAMRSMSTALEQTTYLEQKMQAAWIADNRLTSLRLDIRLGAPVVLNEEEVEQAGKRWITKVVVETTTEFLTRIEVDVYASRNDRDPIYSLSGFIPTYALSDAG